MNTDDEMRLLLQEMEMLLQMREQNNWDLFDFSCSILGWKRNMCLMKHGAQIWRHGPSWIGHKLCETVDELRAELRKDGHVV